MPLWCLFFPGKYKYNLEVYALIKEVVILKLVVVKMEVGDLGLSLTAAEMVVTTIALLVQSS